MNEFIPRGYLTLEKALEHFGQFKHADECEAEKASSKREFQRLLFATDLSAEVLTNDGILHLLRSNIWGSVEAARIFETGRASISVGDFYFPDLVHGVVLIKQSSIDALFDGDSNGPSPSTDRDLANLPIAVDDEAGAQTDPPPKIPGHSEDKVAEYVDWEKRSVAYESDGLIKADAAVRIHDDLNLRNIESGYIAKMIREVRRWRKIGIIPE